MNETLNLTLSTNPLFLFAVGGAIWTIMFGILIGHVKASSLRASDSLRDLSLDIMRKDFSFKPKYSETTGQLQVQKHPNWMN